MQGFAELHDFFVASVGAAAALIGLLFVAISIAPDRVFGPDAEGERRASAERAFTALANVFFLSLCALLPHVGQDVIPLFSLIAMSTTLRRGVTVYRTDGGWRSWRQFGFLSLAVYVLELWFALRTNANPELADKLTFIVLGLYSYALGISWSLLSAKGSAKAS